mgnify:CR=1 FL=1
MNIFKNMKNKFKYKKINQIVDKISFIKNHFVFFDIILFLLMFGKYNSQAPLFKYPQAITLSNGDIFIIHQTGIELYDSNMTTKRSTIATLEEDEKVYNKSHLSKTTISKFKNEDNEYIIALIQDKIFIFDNNGQKLYKSENKIPELQGDYYTLVPIKKDANSYYYIIGFIDSKLVLQLLLYKFTDETKKDNECIKSKSINQTKIFDKGLSCQLMKHKTKNNVLICFYVVQGYPTNFTFYMINPDTLDIINDEEENASFLTTYSDHNIRGIKSATSDNKNVLICYYIPSSIGFCTTYSIDKNKFTEYKKYADVCRDEFYGMTVNCYEEKRQCAFCCTNNLGKIKSAFFEENLELSSSFPIFEDDCATIYGYSLIFSKDNNQYFVISDVYCQSGNNGFQDISEFKDSTDLPSLPNCPEKCSKCNEQFKDLCSQCNTEKNYHRINPIYISKTSMVNNEYFDCYNETTKPGNFFFNDVTNFYEPCYRSCATCKYGGDGNQNNCTSCDYDYMKEPEVENTSNCVVLCKNFYYYTSYKQFKCSSSPQCPEESNLLIRDKKKCVQNCLKDGGEYTYQYNGECWKKCPDDTKADDSDHLCKIINEEACSKSYSEFELYNFLKEGGVEKIAKTYAKEFNYTDKHISIFKNEVYSIMLYKNAECISELELQMPEIDFGSCYIKVQGSINTTEPLVVAIIDKSSNKKSNPITSYSFYHPITGEKLDSETLCKEETILVKENIKSLLNESVSNLDSILFLTDQNINVFNKSCEFYTDLCYHFESPNNKDVALRDRLLVYYPNITLCDSGCTVLGVNLTSITAICQCTYKEMTEDDTSEENVYETAVKEVFNILDQINFAVMSCYQDLFEYKYFIKCTGGLVILCLFFIQCINIIIYYFWSFFNIRKYIYNITENYILFLNNSPMYNPNINNNKKKEDENDKNSSKENAPPKKNISPRQNENSKAKKKDNQKKILKTQDSHGNKKDNKIMICDQKLTTKKKRTKSNSNLTINLDKSLISFKSNEKSNTNPLIKQNNTNFGNSSYYDGYLLTQLNEMRFFDALDKDRRLFFDYFCDKLKRKQVILELCCINDPIKPRTLKILQLILDIEVCFVVNAMFINEDYISKLFNSQKTENFISFLPRCINRSIFTIITSLCISYIAGCLLLEERRIKNILRYEKDNIPEIKYQISIVMKEIKCRYNIFILITLVISFFSWFYISCFNNIYPHTKLEWIKSSLFIIILIHLLSIFGTLIETLLRFISFEIKSEKMFNASLWLS